jgi:hypothetical protein
LDLTIRIDTDPAAILPFLEQFSPWKGLKLDPLLIQAAMDLFEQECADLDALTP